MRLWLLTLLLLFASGAAWAGNGAGDGSGDGGAHEHHHHHHAAPPPVQTGEATRQDELPIEVDIDPAIVLVDHHGEPWSPAELQGQVSLLFFGYASCDGICLAAIPALAETKRILETRGLIVEPVMVTIDPERDTPAAIAEELAKHHPCYTGLTGEDAQLATMRAAFGVRKDLAFEDEGGAVFQHGSFVYVMDRQGGLATVLPPVLPPEQIADIVAGYF